MFRKLSSNKNKPCLCFLFQNMPAVPRSVLYEIRNTHKFTITHQTKRHKNSHHIFPLYLALQGNKYVKLRGYALTCEWVYLRVWCWQACWSQILSICQTQPKLLKLVQILRRQCCLVWWEKTKYIYVIRVPPLLLSYSQAICNVLKAKSAWFAVRKHYTSTHFHDTWIIFTIQTKCGTAWRCVTGVLLVKCVLQK